MLITVTLAVAGFSQSSGFVAHHPADPVAA
jgi:hypothetical protein